MALSDHCNNVKLLSLPTRSNSKCPVDFIKLILSFISPTVGRRPSKFVHLVTGVIICTFLMKWF